MSATDVFALPNSALNAFLYAELGEEANGTMLRLVSVFARIGRDPWLEAKRLSGLTSTEAIDSLVGTLVGMPKSIFTRSDAMSVATRLIALLPAPSDSVRPALTRASLASPFVSDWPGAVRLAGRWLLMATLAFAVAYALGLFGADTRRGNFDDGSNFPPFSSTGAPAPGPQK